MITEKHQQMLEQAVASGDKDNVVAAFRTVLGEEMASVGCTNSVANEYIKRIVENIAAPITTKLEAVIDNTKYPDPRSKDGNGICHLLGSFTALLAVGAVSSKFGIAYGGGLAAIVAAVAHFFKRRKDKTAKRPSPLEPNFAIIEKTNAEGLVASTEKIVNDFKNMVGELMEKPAVNPETKRLPLHECYPNILAWMQTAYSDALDFDEEPKKYLLKRIRNVLFAYGYKIVDYDNSNDELFDIHEEIGLKEAIMTSPTIMFEKTDKIIRLGTVAIPKK